MNNHSSFIAELTEWIAAGKQRILDLDKGQSTTAVSSGGVQTKKDIKIILEHQIAHNEELLKRCQAEQRLGRRIFTL